MKTMPASRALYDYSKLEDTEFALAISPCPRIEESKDIGETADFACARSGLERRRQAQMPRQTVIDEYELTGPLTIGWAIALAMAVALVIHASGG